MQIKLTVDDLPDYPDDRIEPIELEGGITIKLTMRYDEYQDRLSDYGKTVRAERPDQLWDELLDALAEDIEEPFIRAAEYGWRVDDEDFSFDRHSEAPGMYIDSSDGWHPVHWYLPLEGSNAEGGDYPIEERRRWLHADARRIRSYWRGDVYDVVCIAKVYLDGMEVGRGYFGCESDAGDYLLEVYNEALSEALSEAKKTVADLAGKLAGGNPLADLEVGHAG